MKFLEYNFKSYINEALKSIDFVSPTAIQELIIPKVLENKNVIGKSATGSGKTHAFILPLLQKLDSSLKEIQIVIISPTRELATQLYNDIIKITNFNKNIDVRLYVGGTNRDNEIKRLEKSQPQIVVSTLGKLKDLAVTQNVLKIYTSKSIVIDEADMLFVEKELVDIDNVFKIFNKDIQILSFSATIPQNLISFLNKYFSNFEICDTLKKRISKDAITHVFIPTKNKNKEELLLSLLKSFTPYLVLIFANTKVRVDEIATFLVNNNIKLLKLTGDLEARERKQVLKRIKDGQVQYVVASDIAARGIDIDGVSHVINVEIPDDIEFYIHRSGRTARYNYTGTCISFYDYNDDEYINKLEKKGLKCEYRNLKNGELVPTKERNYVRKISSTKKKIEEELHVKIPLPKKVKPGYKKKRKMEIEKKLKKMKRQVIDKKYNEMNNRSNKNENR